MHGFKRLSAAVRLALFLPLLMALTGAQCLKRPELPAAPVPVVSDAGSLILAVRERALEVDRMDATLLVRLSGATAAFRGRYYGTLQMERTDEGGLAMLLQLYSLMGAPVLEVVAIGERVQVYSPLDRTVFVNFHGLYPGEMMEEFPISSFDEIAVPLDLLKTQMELLWGLGLSGDYRYELVDLEGSHLLTEWSGDSLVREMEYLKPGLELVRASIYRGGVLFGRMECGDHGRRADPGGFIPRKIEVFQEGVGIALELSNARFNGEVTASPISFKTVPRRRLVLLTPPVP